MPQQGNSNKYGTRDRSNLTCKTPHYKEEMRFSATSWWWVCEDIKLYFNQIKKQIKLGTPHTS